MKRKEKSKNKRIFIGIGETSGYYGRLYCGLRELGVQCVFAELIPNKHRYKYKYKVGNIVTNACKYFYEKNWILYYLLKSVVFIWALLFFDVFIFTACETFWGNKEFWVYKLLRKKTVMICLGRLTRLAYANGTDIDTRALRNNDGFNFQYILQQVEYRKNMIWNIEDKVDIFVNHSAQAQLNRKPFVSLAYLGIPIDLEEIENKENNKEESKKNNHDSVKILHAASTLGCRGTVQFRRCIEELKKDYDIEYIELTNVPNNVVIEKIKECDFVIDELWSDTPMATFAEEAAFFGKPTIVCGYFAKYYKSFYPDWSCPPSIFVEPDKIKNAIKHMIDNPLERQKLGKKAQEFVCTYMNHKSFAERFLNVIDGNIDKKWIIDPLEIGYLEGYGIDKTVQVHLIKELNKRVGIERMGVTHNSLLMQEVERIVSEKEE